MKRVYYLLFFLLIGWNSNATIFIEAESGELNGVNIKKSTDCSGGSYVGDFDAKSDYAKYNFDVQTAGIYELTIRFNSPEGIKWSNINVNSETQKVEFPQTVNWQNKAIGRFYLNVGMNTIKVENNYGYYNLDNFTLNLVAAMPIISPSTSLVDAKATSETKALYNYLKSIYGKKTLAGQHENLDYIVEKTGKEPAVASFDLMDYSLSRVAKNGKNPSSTPNNVPGKHNSENNIAWSKKDKNRGIISLVWHWNAPADLLDLNEEGKRWYSGFYTKATTFDLSEALANKNDPDKNEKYNLIIKDIDAIAVELKKYQKAHVPILWRPLHEASGDPLQKNATPWFWWGAKGSGPFKQLWHMMYDRLVNYHKIHNLIWVYTANNNENLDWYPGNDYVDIISLDVYDEKPTSTMLNKWEGAQHYLRERNANKMVALSETGNLPNPDAIRLVGSWWLWFANWSGTRLTNQADSILKKIFQDEDVITLDELPNWSAIK